MVPRNLGHGESGVIVDVCGEHGLWFDDEELSLVIAWIRTGGLESARRDAALLKNSPDVQRKRLALSEERSRLNSQLPEEDSLVLDERRRSLARDLGKVFGGLFGWSNNQITWLDGVDFLEQSD